MKPSIIDIEGKRFALLPFETYEQLAEDAEMLADIHAYKHAKALDEEAFPLALFDQVAAGESPVRVFRTYRNMTQAMLAQKAGLERVAISHIETKARQGTVEQLKAIATALEVTLDDLVG